MLRSSSAIGSGGGGRPQTHGAEREGCRQGEPEGEGGRALVVGDARTRGRKSTRTRGYVDTWRRFSCSQSNVDPLKFTDTMDGT